MKGKNSSGKFYMLHFYIKLISVYIKIMNEQLKP